MTGRGLLLAVAVLALFLAIFVPLARRINGGRDAAIDADRLRHTYVAIALYENEHDGDAPPNLALVRRDVEASDLQSVDDPEVGKGGSFPLDPALPNLPLRFPTRVSWSYRYHWREAGGSKGFDPRQGLLADWWTGPVLTVTMDGAIVQRSTPTAPLDFRALFGR